MRCYEMRSAEHGDDHTQTLVVLASLAQVWHGLRRHEEAAQAFAKMLAARERIYGSESLLTAQSRNDLATQYVLLGRASDAIPMLRQALRVFERDLSERHPITISATNNLAKCLVDDGKPEEALEYAERAVRLCKAHVAAKHVLTGFSLSVLGEILIELERFAEARDALQESYPIIVAARGADSSACGPTLRRLARAHTGLGEMSTAAEWTRQADELENE